MFRAPIRTTAALLVATAGLTSCDKPIAIGRSENVVVAARDAVWDALSDDIDAAIEPRIFTVRDERIFQVSHVDPTGEGWGDLRHVRRILVIGEPEDPWVAEALDEANADDTAPPAVVQARSVWAKNQDVTIVVLAPGSDPAAAGPLIVQAGEGMIQRYERESRARMFATGLDSTTADSLRREAGFWLLAPEVYRTASPEENVVMIRNDNPDPSQLIRQVHVAWQEAGEVETTGRAALEWRSDLASRVTQPPQATRQEIVQERRITQNGHPAVEIHGVWSNPEGEWPAAGPFITRLVECPDRIYLVDAWLYAPGRSKYPYMIQLETLLSSFRCG